MARHRRMLVLLGLVSAAALLCLTSAARAQPSADQVLADFGVSAEDKQRVLNGEFVTADASTVSDRDLAVSLVFLVKTSPDALSKQIMAGNLVTADSQVQSFGALKSPGSLEDLAGLQISADEAKALSSAQAGGALNLAKSEMAAFNAVPGGAQQAIRQQLRQMLLARYQAYRASGLAGILPYARGGGSDSDLASDLRKASQAAKGLEKYLPKFQAVLLGYPQATVPGMQENFLWIKYNIQGKPTYVLQHVLAAADGAARAVVQRQYYASTGYNGEQAVAGFLPVQGGTIVVYSSHAFTDQVAGFGGSMKRGIGSRVMAGQLKKMFESGRTKIGQ